jgi:predicted TIM-barrel fold metal-dependent hydrolase
MTHFVRSDSVARIKNRVDHPIIDADGHYREFFPLVREIVRETADGQVLARFDHWIEHDRARVGSLRGFWPFPVENVLDRVTSVVPELLYQRLDEIGLDFALLYPTTALSGLAIPDPEVRGALCHGLNAYVAEVFDGYRDRLEPVASIPTWTPEEAIAELDHAVGELGLKAVVMSAIVPRAGRPSGETEQWIDTLALGSIYDYDPVWRRCAELGVVPSFHGLGYGWGSRHSTKSYMYNHIGSFAAAQEAACRSILLGGVAARFPTLRFSFLEGGVAWACQLLADTIGHYEKRNRNVIGLLDPATLDVERSVEHFGTYARGRMATMLDRYTARETAVRDAPPQDPASIDEFADAQIDDVHDIVATFVERFYFGCEADDPMNALAFDARRVPHGARLNAMVASDIGHWDVPDMRNIVPEAWEQVEDGRMSEDDFRAFTCTNVVRMLTAVSPTFFEGTAVESAVAPFLPADNAAVSPR